MKRRYKAGRFFYASLAAVTAVTAAAPMTVNASTSTANFDMRKKVVDLLGILSVTDYTGQVTRSEFAKMLVNASSYRENLPVSSVSVFADVPMNHENAVYIRIAASQGWMSGFLGGMFKPDDYITYKDASKAFLTMLGYADSDFTGDLATSRISKFNYLELNEKVSRQPDEVLNQTDCVNIFYNLLKAKKKDSNEIYGAVLGCELNSDGEINPITILDDERKGPILVRKGFSISESVPFSTENANVFLNGVASSLAAVNQSQREDVYKRQAKRGVDVTLIMPHIPDKLYAYLLARTYYPELIEAGVKVYEYTPGFVHAKEFISDDSKAVVGTINLDFRSLYLHFECAAYIYKNPVVLEIERDFQATITKCKPVTLEECRRYPFFKRAAGRALRLFAPLM